MQTLLRCISLGKIARYKPGTSIYVGELPFVMALDTKEVDEDVSSIFMCTSGLDENFCFHQKMDRLGSIIPSLGLFNNSWKVIIPGGSCGGDATYNVYAWDTIPGHAWILKGYPNMSFLYGGNIYINVSITVYAANPSRPSDQYFSWRYGGYSLTISYTLNGDEAIRNSLDLSSVPEYIRYMAQAIYDASPVSIYRSDPFTESDLELLFRSVYPWFHYMMRFYDASDYPTSSYIPQPLVQLGDFPRAPELALFDEPLRYQGYPMIGYTSNYWFDLARQRSFIAACETVPRLSDNSLSNILELTNFIYNLVVKHKVEIPSSLSEAWLAYRYQYTTTKFDMKEAISFVGRHLPANIWDIGYKAKGVYFFTYKDVSVTARCSLTIYRRDLDLIHNVWIKLFKYGLTPNFYVVWDMIPFSFIADWFIPVGDALRADALGSAYTKENYEFEHIVYSLKYSRPGEYNVSYSLYYRWVEDSPPDILGYYWFEKDTVSNKTLCKRVADILSLLY